MKFSTRVVQVLENLDISFLQIMITYRSIPSHIKFHLVLQCDCFQYRSITTPLTYRQSHLSLQITNFLCKFIHLLLYVIGIEGNEWITVDTAENLK